MEFERTPSPRGYCTFCEDIRQEISGKQTFVGVIPGSELTILGPLPAVVGKFCISVMFRQRFSDSLEMVSIEVHLPGDDDDKPSMKAEFSLEEAVAKMPPPSDIDDPFIGIGMKFEFHPLELKSEGRIQVSAVKGGKRYRIGSLKVISRPPAPKEIQPKEAAN
jgi:hypothetical protein